MANKKPRTILYRRKKEQKTDYKKRLRLIMSKKPRIVVRFSNKRVIAQLVQFASEGDLILVGTDSFALTKLGWKSSTKSIPATYLTGLLLGKMAIKKGIKEGIMDVGFKSALPKGKVYAFLKGVIDSGMNLPYGNDKEIFPSEERISGKHIADYTKNQDLIKMFEEVKNKILKE